MIAWFRKHLLRSRKPRRTRPASGISCSGLRRPLIEPLELRRLLTVTASETSGALSVQISGTDTAVITADSDNDVLVEDSTGTVVFAGLAASVTSISVASSGTNDTTDLTGVGSSSDFTSLATIDIGAGSGAQVLLSGTYTTTGDQTYSAAATLKGDTRLNSGGSIDFAGTIDGGFTLTTNATTAVTFAGAVGDLSELTGLYVVGGTADLNAGSVHTTRAQAYSNAVTLTANTTLISDTEGIAFESTLDGAFSLTTSATLVQFEAAVGAAVPLASLTTSGVGQTAISSAINTSGFQSYQQAVLLAGINEGDVIALSTQGGDVTFGGTVDSYAIPDPEFTLTINTGAGSTTFDGAVGTTMALDDLTVSSGAIDLNAGSVQTLGAQTYNAPTVLTLDTTLTSTGSGDITFSQTLDSSVAGPFALTVNTAGTATFGGLVGGARPLASLTTTGAGSTVLTADVNTTGDQTYGRTVVLDGDVVLNTQGGNVSFEGTIDSFAGTGITSFSLAISTTNAGTTTLLGAVGATAELTSLTVTSGAIDLNSGSVRTSGTQTYNAPTQLTVDTVLTSTGSGDITFSQTLNSGLAGPFTLNVNTAGTTTFGGLAGSVLALRTLTTDSDGTTAINGGGITTTGAQTYNDAVTLGSPATALTSTAGGGITFNSTLDGASALSVHTSGATTFNGSVGGTTTLSSITTDAPGTTTINGGAVTTTGNQTYNDAVTLGTNTTIAATSAGNIAFNNTLNGPFALGINTAGTTTFGGAVGGATPLTSLTTDAPGTTAINGSAITTTGAQTYGDNVTLGGAATTLTTTTGAITFAQNVDGAANLIVDGTAGTTFAGTVGGNAALASLSVTGNGMTVLAANVNTIGDQNYQQNVGLIGNVVLGTQGGSIFFAGDIDSQAGSGSPLFSLSINTTAAGMTTFQGPIGTEVELASLAVTSGEIDLNGGTVLTTGAQSYDGPTAITTDTSLTSTANGNITFTQTLDSAEVPFSLSVNTAGTTTFGGVVGGLGALATLTTDSGGTTAINGGSVTTTGAQTYSDAVTLGGSTTTLASTSGAVILFAQTLDGASALAVSTAGLTFFGGPVGGTTPLASLAVNVGETRLSGPVSTIGNQSYQGPVTLLQNVTITTRGGNVSFASTIDGFSFEGQVLPPVALTIDTTNAGTAPAGGLVAFGGDIGGTVPLSTLTVTAAGPLTLAHQITTIGNQLFMVVPSSAASGLTLAAGGSLSSQSAVELRSGGNLTIASGGNITASSITLRGDFNNANAAAATVVLLAGNLQSPTIAVFTGNGNTTVDVLRTLANTATTISGGAGMDTYNISSAAPAPNGVLATLAGAIIINGGSGSNTLVLGDAADLPGLPGTLTASLITGFGMAGIQYANLQSIVFRLSSGAAETLSIVSTSPGTAVAVNGGQMVVVGGAPGGLDQIGGPLAINGTNVLDINDTSSAVPHTYDISANFFLRTDAGASNLAAVNSAAVPGQVGIALANVKNITINGGTANNVYNVFLPLAPGQSVVIRGGGADNDVNVIGSTAGPNTAYVGNIGSGDPIQIGGVDCLTMYGAVNQPNTFVNQTAIRSILIGGMGNDTLVGGSGPDVLFGGAGNDLLIAGGTAGSPGTDYTFANLLPVYLSNGMLNPDVGDATVYPGLPGTSIIDGGGGVVVYFYNGTQVFNAANVTMMECDLATSRAMLQSIFNQAIAGNECLATLTSPPNRPSSVGTLATVANYGPYVERAYEDLLGRAADPAALSYWTAQLAGGLPRASFTNALTHSDEYYRRLVADDYEAYLGRAVDAASLGYWTNQFEHGLNDEQFKSMLLGSDEFYQHTDGDNSAWINAVYQALLSRSADPQSDAYWNNQLQAGVSRQQIAYEIATSAEAFALVVEADYQHDLGRTAGAAEVNYWVGQFENGASDESVIASFVASEEFFSMS